MVKNQGFHPFPLDSRYSLQPIQQPNDLWSQMLHVWNIYLHLEMLVNIPYMEHMGITWNNNNPHQKRASPASPVPGRRQRRHGEFCSEGCGGCGFDVRENHGETRGKWTWGNKSELSKVYSNQFDFYLNMFSWGWVCLYRIRKLWHMLVLWAILKVGALTVKFDVRSVTWCLFPWPVSWCL